jgi:hypothetical protein
MKGPYYFIFLGLLKNFLCIEKQYNFIAVQWECPQFKLSLTCDSQNKIKPLGLRFPDIGAEIISGRINT